MMQGSCMFLGKSEECRMQSYNIGNKKRNTFILYHQIEIIDLEIV